MPWVLGCVAAIVAFEVGAWLTASRPAYKHVWADIAWVAVDLFALAMCWRAARRAQPHVRRSWWCFTITMMCFTAGMLAWAFNELVGGKLTPFPSITDVLGWIGAPFLIAGIFFYKAPSSSRALGLQHLADLALTVAAMVSVTIAILYVPTVNATYPTTYIASALASPILSITAAAFGLLTLWQHVSGPRRRVLGVMWVAVLLLGVAVVLYAEALLAGRYSAGQFLDLLWVLAFLAFATAAREELRLGDEVDTTTPERTHLLAPLVPTAALVVWMVAWLASSERALLAINAVTGGLLAVALFVRVWATQRIEASLAARVAREEARAWQLEARLARVHKLEALGTLAGGIAHDFNNVLGSATAALKLARRKLTRGASVARDLDEIDGVLWRAADLTSRLLDLARKREPRPVAINPRDAIERVCVLLEKVVPANVKIAIECATNLPAVNVDPSGLEHALLNLGLNARDAVRDRGGTITMRARIAASSGAVELEVADDGTGIPANLLPRLFEPFFTTKSEQGTGLGLAMVDAFTSANGGTVSVTSEPGCTRFSLAFPAVTSVAPATILPEPTATVLVVSREDAAGLATAGVLNRGGIAATVAHDATTALAECARLSHVDAVIVDGATGVAGRDTLRALRDAGVDASSVLLAGPGSDDTGEWTAVVSKPYDPLGLVEEVHRAIAKRVAHANPPR